MVALVALIAFAAGLLVGAFAAATWLRRQPVAAVPSVPAAVEAAPVAAPQPPAPQPPAPHGVIAPVEQDGDADLEPVLDATRGVLTELEQRYQGARAEPGRPKRRSPRSRA